MDYIIVQNRQTVLLGPMGWRQRMFQSEINDLVDQGELTAPYQLPPVEQGYINVGDGIEIFPVISITVPEHDPTHQYLSGPYYTYAGTQATGTYTVAEADISVHKTNLINIVTGQRYVKEVAGTTMTLQGQTVTLDTSRDGRNIFALKYMLMTDTDVINWKFPEGWLILTKAELGSVVETGAAYIQAQFDWENEMTAQIHAATDTDALHAIAASIASPTPNKPNLIEG